MMSIKKILLLVFGAFMFLWGAYMNSPLSFDYQKDTILIASEPDYPPYCFVDENGLPAGFAIDLFRAAADVVDLKVEIKIGLWNQIKEDLALGKIDALPFVGRTPERENIFDFTMSYLSLHGAIFIRKGNHDITSLSDLKNKSVVVMKGDNAEEFVNREHISDKIITTNTYEEAFYLLSHGRYDAVITQRIMGLDLLKQLKIHNVVALDFLLSDFRQDFCFAVQKGNDVLLRKLNEGLSVVIANNTFNTIRNQWFGPDQTNVISLRKTLMIALYIIIPLFIIYAIVIMLFLRKEVRKRTRDLKNEINEHKKTLTSLQQRNIMLNEMEKVSLIGAWEYDIKTKEITWTSGVYDIFGVDAETFDPSHYELDIAFYHERDQEVLNQAFQKLIETGTPYDLELELSAASGESKWVRTRGRAEHRNGKIIRIYGDIQDVTIIKKINDELKESVQQLRLLMNSTGEGIIGVDKDGICTFCNMSALKTLNYHAKTDVIGKNMHQLIHYAYEDGSRHPIEKSIIHQVLRTGQGTRTDEDILWRSDGSCFYAEIFSYPIMENDDIKGAVVTFFDISKRKKAQDELNELKNNLEKQIKERTRELNKKVNTLDKSQKAMLYMIEDLNDITAELKSKREELESANKELEAFAYSVSHDLRAPLRAIDGFSKFLYEDYANKIDDEGKRLIDVIRSNTQKMDHLITDILNLSRISRTQMDIAEVDMTSMAKHIYQETASEVERREFTFKVNRLPKVMADKHLIRQVWKNLIENALKYSSRSKTKEITISAKQKKDSITFLIKDKGAGFNPHYTHKLFGVFQRLHSEEEFSGTGIGLAIVQRIIHRHGGTVGAEGAVNKGATFFFTLEKIEKKKEHK